MSKAPKASSEKSPTFEETLGRLEAIVEAMESDALPLESLIEKFEEGSNLAKQCQARLAEAELKVQQIEKTAGANKIRALDDAE